MDPLRWKQLAASFMSDAAPGRDTRTALGAHSSDADQDILTRSTCPFEGQSDSTLSEIEATVSRLDIKRVVAGRFRIIRYVAQGGMGTVYEAEDLELSDRVALKAIRPQILSNPKAVERFKREVLLGKRVTHPNVCRIHDLGVDRAENGTEFLFLTMQFLAGETLLRRLSRGPMCAQEAEPLIADMADALSAAHKADILHRDFKSSNVMLVPASDRICAVVTDFGLSRSLHEDRSLVGTPVSQGAGVGTVEYMAPEQIKGEDLTPAADIYSLGVVMYEIVTGHPPFTGSSKVAIALKHVNDAPTAPRDLVPDLNAIWNDTILRCLEKKPEKRFQSASDVKAALASTNSELVLPQKSSSASQVVRRPVWIHHWIWMAILLGVLAGSWLVSRHYNGRQLVGSVAIFPIANRTGNADFDYMSQGITVALTNDLSQVSGLRVPANSIVRRLALTGEDPQAVGRQLGVESIIDGALSKHNAGVTLQLELIDVHTGSQIWGKSYDRQTSDLASLQEDVSVDLAYRLRLNLTEDAASRWRRQYGTTADTYDAYLKGRYALNQRTSAGFESALNFFQQAIEKGPTYAPAYAALADCYDAMAYNRYQPSLALLEKAKTSANRALQLDSTLADAYSSLAAAQTLGDFNWAGSEENYKRALQLNPNYVPARVWYGLTLLTPLGRFMEARAQLNYARNLDSESLMTHAGMALALYQARQYQEAIAEAKILREKFPAYEAGSEILAGSELAAGQFKDAIQFMLGISPVSEDAKAIRNVMLGIAYARTGRRDKALVQLHLAEQEADQGASVYFQLAALLATLGSEQSSLNYLAKAYSSRQTTILFINVDPLMDPLREDPEFKKLVAEVHLDVENRNGGHR